MYCRKETNAHRCRPQRPHFVPGGVQGPKSRAEQACSIIENQAALIEGLLSPQAAAAAPRSNAGAALLQRAADDSNAQLTHCRKTINELHAERDQLAQQLQAALLALDDRAPASASTPSGKPTPFKPADRKLFATELRRLQDANHRLTTERGQAEVASKKLTQQLQAMQAERDQLRDELRTAHDKWRDVQGQLQHTVRDLQASKMSAERLQEQLEAARTAQADIKTLQAAFHVRVGEW